MTAAAPRRRVEQPEEVPPPWTCRLRAVVRLRLARWHVSALAVVAYAQTPVGPYGEALLAEVRLPLVVSVPWIVVDSGPSLVAGRQHWGLPKQRASFELDPDALSAAVRLPGSSTGDLHLRARAAGPWLPVVGAAVLRQPGRPGAPLLLRGRARPAHVRVEGGPAAGAGPGFVLDGVLRLGGAWPLREQCSRPRTASGWSRRSRRGA